MVALRTKTRGKDAGFSRPPLADLFRMIVESGDDLIAVLDLDGRRLYNSPSYARLFGEFSRLQGTDSFAEIHPDDKDNVVAAFRSTVETGRSHRLNYRFVLADGSTRYMESCGALVRNSEGEPFLVVVSSRDVTERETKVAQLELQALYDGLTGLPNRRLFSDRFEQAMAACRRSGRHGALMLIDLDNFKEINDSQGHPVGDLLLMEVANRIAGSLRETDVVARFGGDEFVVLCTELSADRDESQRQADMIAEKIRAALAGIFTLDAAVSGGSQRPLAVSCTASVGVVLFKGQELAMAELIGHADVAMYQAKQSGRNQSRRCGG